MKLVDDKEIINNVIVLIVIIFHHVISMNYSINIVYPVQNFPILSGLSISDDKFKCNYDLWKILMIINFLLEQLNNSFLRCHMKSVYGNDTLN